jgi:C-methyltransferase C-terminal domain
MDATFCKPKQSMITSACSPPTEGTSPRAITRSSRDLRCGNVKAVLAAEEAAGLHTVAGHEGFAAAVLKIKNDLLDFLLATARDGRSVAGYGAPGKGNTLLNHCGIRSDLLSYTVDRSPVKQGKFLPGTHIPIYAPEHLAETRPDYILVLPWNLRDEISRQLSYVGSWGAKLVVPIPELEIFPVGV